MFSVYALLYLNKAHFKELFALKYLSNLLI